MDKAVEILKSMKTGRAESLWTNELEALDVAIEVLENEIINMDLNNYG